MRFALYLLLAFSLCAGGDLPWQNVLERLRSHVRQQVNQVANYECVQSVDRSYFTEFSQGRSGCSNAERRSKHLYMRDRLRLDVAVSEGREIFSWHGGKSFSSKGVDDVVRSGPISSGSFVGYLRNIFFENGIKINFAGSTSSSGESSYIFDYVVPRDHSRYQVANGKQRWTVPFHGRFSSSGTNYELTSLQVIADELPPESQMCSAASEINYQLLNIGGKLSLIPRTYALNISNDYALYTTSRSEYTQCREFRGESTISFDIKDEPEAGRASAIHDEWLPVGTTLHARLRTPVDDRTSFMGDPVEGSLIDPIKIKKLGITIPKDAILHGVINKLELYEEPFRHCLASIRFQRLTFGPNSFLLDATPVSSNGDRKWLAEAYHGQIPPGLGADLENGLFVWTSSHFHKDQHFTADWKTRAPAANSPE
jgi:hypothetical protein